jgi:HD-like signal output (HDOD) protein/ActR/RegA family two-component response regulator
MCAKAEGRLVVETGTAAAKRRILFVDDEPNVLDGLRNLLHKQRHQWEMLFASSGKAALEELALAPFDVIVSDMRMPGMDGAELLGRVRELYPQTARIVLSGHAERDAIARVVSVAHQFLSKPADANTVRVVIERTCRFQALMLDTGLRRVIGAMEQLPSLPDTYVELVRATEDPDAAIGDIAKSMSVKVLQLVNSAYFGLAQKTESITRAVTYLGIENLKGLLVAVHVFSPDNFPVIAGLSPASLRDQALLTATLARQIVRDPKLADAAFASGIVHDIGHIVLARDPSKRYAEVWRAAHAAGEPIQSAEMRELGVSHGMVGAYLLGVWGLPFVIAETVAFHDIPSSVSEGNLELLAAVHLADGVVNAAFAGRDPLAAGDLDAPFLNKVGLLVAVPKWHEKAVAGLASRVGGG